MVKSLIVILLSLPCSVLAGTVAFNTHEDMLATVIVFGFFLLLSASIHLYKNLRSLPRNFDFEVELGEMGRGF